jgi:hypothetical protein
MAIKNYDYRDNATTENKQDKLNWRTYWRGSEIWFFLNKVSKYSVNVKLEKETLLQQNVHFVL